MSNFKKICDQIQICIDLKYVENFEQKNNQTLKVEKQCIVYPWRKK